MFKITRNSCWVNYMILKHSLRNVQTLWHTQTTLTASIANKINSLTSKKRNVTFVMEPLILSPEYVISSKLWSLTWKILKYCWPVTKQLKINRKSKTRLMDQLRYVLQKSLILEMVWDASAANSPISILSLLLNYARHALRKISLIQQLTDVKKLKLSQMLMKFKELLK